MSAGNSVVRTSRYSMLNAYQLLLDHCEVQEPGRQSFLQFPDGRKSTFAYRIDIRNSHFPNISGAILELDKETDDLGLYNAEYVSIADSTFKNIGEAWRSCTGAAPMRARSARTSNCAARW